MSEITQPIPARLRNVAVNGHVAGAADIIDDNLNKTQAVINAEIEEVLGDGGNVAFIDDDDPGQAVVPSFDPESQSVHVTSQVLSEQQKAQARTNIGLNDVDTRISNAVASEASRAQAAEADRYTKSETYTKTEVNGLVDTPHQEYVTVDAYANLPATGSKDTIYRVSNYNGSTSQVDVSVYSEYAWDGSQYVFLCVKSQIGEVFDISVYNNNAKYADLAAALNGGANIPQSIQKGGMSVKFVQSSDNDYVQYLCNSQTFTTDVNAWEKTNLEQEVVSTKNDVGELLQNIIENWDENIDFADNLGNVILRLGKNGVQLKELMPQIITFISGYIYTDTDFTVTDLDGNVVFKISNNGVKFKELIPRIACFGDSLTQGQSINSNENKAQVLSVLANKGFDVSALENTVVTYPKALQVLAGIADVYNCGVGGENVDTIGARAGANAALLPYISGSDEITIPASSATKVMIAKGSRASGHWGDYDSTHKCLKSSWDDRPVVPLLQGSADRVNPCFVDGIECNMSVVKTTENGVDVATWYLQRVHNNSISTTIRALGGTPIIFNDNKKESEANIAIYFIGTNNNGGDSAELVEKIKRIAESGTPHYLVIGLGGDTDAQRRAMADAFGTKYFNWGLYAADCALYDFGITPTTEAEYGTQSDEYYMRLKAVPPSLKRKIDGDMTHYNEAGYLILAYMVYNKIKELGYIN